MLLHHSAAQRPSSAQRMSQPKPKFTEIDYSTAMDRPTPLPITNLPVNALSDDTDPTREIRTLIEQLQQSARDARTQCRTVEEQRDESARQLEIARRQNEELRAHFVEITSILRERDAALQEVDRHARLASEAQSRTASTERLCQELRRQQDETVRQRDTATRERDDLLKKLETLNQAYRDASRMENDAQRQLLAVRQARDSALSQSMQASQKLELSADTIAELEYQVEQLQRQTEELPAAKERLQSLEAERNEAARSSEALASRLAGLETELSEATTVRDAALSAAGAHTSALAELHDQVEALSTDRESLAAEIERQTKEIETLRPVAAEQAALTATLKGEISALQHECSTEELRVQVLSREVIDLRNQLQDRAEKIENLQRTADQGTTALSQMQASVVSLSYEREVAQRMREESATALAAAQKQIDKIIRERDIARHQSDENAIGMEAQIEALMAQLKQFEEAGEGGAAAGNGNISEMARLLEAREAEKRELADRLEQQRTETIDLAAQLREAQQQIKQLSASIGELRIQAKQTGQYTPQAVVLTAEPAPIPAESFGATEMQEVVRGMRRCYQAFLKNPADVSHLNELHCQAHAFSEAAGAAGLPALHRLSAAFSGLSQELYRYPEHVAPPVLRTIGQTVEFLTTLLKVKDLRKAKDPATSRVYVVEDDLENSDCIRMAMETASMQTLASEEPVKALCELAETPCDLIILDVSLPGMDGFELCTEIRQLTLHATTPIIFLTGLASSENRTHSSLCGGNEFVGKPFLLCELTLKALTLIVKAQLHLA